MSETVAIQFIEALTSRDVNRIKGLSTGASAASGGVLPGTIALGSVLPLVRALWMALPDFYCEILNIETHGEEVMVEFCWGGTHTGSLELPFLGLPPVAPTGKVLQIPDVFFFSFLAKRIRAVRIESPAAGGIPGLLAQLNITVPYTQRRSDT